jgi:hypothetical protein
VLRPMMHPWHTLVCGAHVMDVLAAANQFISDCGEPAAVRKPRDLPARVSRLIEMADQRRRRDFSAYLDDAYWGSEINVPDELVGLMVVRDQR